MTDALVVAESNAGTALASLTVDEVAQQVQQVQQLMKAVMKKDEHYGVIKGTTKPTLYKAGAEKICFMFRLSPSFETRVAALDGPGHREAKSTCTLTHMPSGVCVAQASGSCSTMESKYRWRERPQCPECGQFTIYKSKQDPGFFCWAKMGGCGEQFRDQTFSATRTENPDIADCWNTILKMAQKRALVAAVLMATAVSDIFTQDLEDTGRPDLDGENIPVPESPGRSASLAAASQQRRRRTDSDHKDLMELCGRKGLSGQFVRDKSLQEYGVEPHFLDDDQWDTLTGELISLPDALGEHNE